MRHGNRPELQRNLLLRAVLAVGEPLSPLHHVTLSAGQGLFTRPEHGRNVYFPLDSVISMVVCFADGGWSEVLSVGRRARLALFNPAFMYFPGHEVLVTLEGEALIADFGDLERRALDRPESLPAPPPRVRRILCRGDGPALRLPSPPPVGRTPGTCFGRPTDAAARNSV